ncbi:PstS family phosphate ABC transporter substrate-binding protein [bacterium]|nr:PstS family phosphate ABC transporter substrate-binding protein [bacterium]
MALLAGCPKKGGDSGTTEVGTEDAPPAAETPGSDLSGAVNIDGSSTVYPITEAVAEEFMNSNPGVNVTVGISGTGGGFKRFAGGETDISNASRAIKQEEADACAAASIGIIELPVAFDGLTVVVNPQNDWCSSITIEELKKIWDQGSTVKKWSDVRAEWPAEDIKLFGPGTDSGTFDYFTEAVNGKSKQCRTDFTASEDDNVLVTGVAGDKYAMGYFGLAYFEENMDKLKALSVDGGNGPVDPSKDSVMNGTYSPLSRPLFIYVSDKAAERPELEAFVTYYLDHAGHRSAEVGYIPLPDSAYALIRERWTSRTLGSVFVGRETTGMTIEQILAAEGGAEAPAADGGEGAPADGSQTPSAASGAGGL